MRRAVRITLSLIVCLTFFLTAPMGAAETVDRIVANVNGKVILLSELRDRLKVTNEMQARQRGPKTAPMGEEEALQFMIEEKIIARYAAENNIVIRESDVDKSIQSVLENNRISRDTLEKSIEREGMTMKQYRKKLKEQLTIQRITGMELEPREPTEEQMRRYYERHKSLFKLPGKVRASHIILLASRQRDPDYFAKAEKIIREVLAKIKKGADFSDMAKKYSQDGSALKGGDLGWFGPGKMIPAFERVAFSAPVGVVQGPVETPFGLHLIKVTDKEPPHQAGFEEAKLQITKAIKGEEYKTRRSEWIKKLRDEAYIEILY